MSEFILETKNISKEFSGVRVLNDINIKIKSGEIYGIIGENGAGKSTLIKIINGTHPPTTGKIYFEDKPRKMSIQKAKDLGIVTIPQEFNLINDLNVYENIFLGQEYKQKKFLLNRTKMKQKTVDLLKSLEVEINPEKRVGNLSAANKQMVEIAKAMNYNSKLLIMDEPSTVLTPTEIEVLFKLMRKLKDQGVTIIYISHKLSEIKKICDRVLVLMDGDYIAVNKVDEITEHQMANQMVGRELTQMFPEKIKNSKEKILEVKNLSINGLLKNINFSLYKGEILGFSGLMGSGRTELAESIYGVRTIDQGSIYIKGEKVEINSSRDAVKNGIALLPEDRQGTGLLTNFNLAENINLINLAINENLFLNHKKEREKTKKYIKKFDIDTPGILKKVINLSGGNQQKVLIAKSIDVSPEIVIFDEPTRGIDVGAKIEIFKFIHQLVEEGISCIFISSEMEEIIGMSTRVVVLRSGEIMGILEGEEINEEEIMYHATGVKKSENQI